jgi:hypothetical protein
MKTITALLLASSLVGCASAPLERHDKALEIAYQTIHAIDETQTARITEHGLREVGPARIVLGEHPDPEKTLLLFVATGVMHYLIVKHLPPKMRPWFQGFTIAESGYYVIDNHKNGL